MTILKQSGLLSLTCDTCGYQAKTPESFAADQFAALKRWFEVEGWKAKRRAAEWEHRCPTCAKFQDGRLL